jgi:hypothetical protein
MEQRPPNESKLAEGFIENNAGGGGEVEAAGAGEHGNLEGALGVGGEEGGGEAGGFLAQEDPGVRGELRGPEGLAGEAGSEDEGVGTDGGQEGGEVIVDGDGHMPEVVHAGALKVFVGEEEAQRAHEVEGGAGGGAEAGDVAGVLGDFGFNEDEF